MGKLRPSAAFDEFVGSAGGLTVVRGRTGMVTRSAPRFRRAISPAQAGAMARMERAGLAWEGLSDASVAAWRAYAKTITRRDDVTGKSYNPVAFNLFSGLYCKLLQMDAAAPVPLHPPFGSFQGDSITVSVSSGSPSPDGSFGRGGRGERSPEPPSPAPSSKTIHLEEGVLTFTASGPNHAGVRTELLYQKLPGKHRLPKPKSKSAGFASFAPGNLTFTLPVEPGYYFCSYAFVEAATGRATMVVPLGTVAVAGA